jgi:hypothetical protein
MLLKSLSFVSALSAAVVVFAASSPARAAREDLGPCGTFDFSDGLNCKLEVSGGCTGKCAPLQVTAACQGGCTASSTQSNCTNNCGTQCIKECNPKMLDCFVGCHAECDGPVEAQCKAKGGVQDCKVQAQAQCDMHCKDSCKIPPSNCDEHCNTCCTGACDTQLNFDCDLKCTVDVQAKCDVACKKPEGAVFCNGQYVNATDVKACVTYLATRNIKVDTSASGSVTCTGTDCAGVGDIKGCSTGSANGYGVGLLAVVGMTLARRLSRRRSSSTAQR